MERNHCYLIASFPWKTLIAILVATRSGAAFNIAGTPDPKEARIFDAFEVWLEDVAGLNITRDFGLAFTYDSRLTSGRGRGVVAVRSKSKGDPCFRVPIALALSSDGMLPIIRGVRHEEKIQREMKTGRKGGGKIVHSGVDEADEAEAEAIALRLAYEASIGPTSQYAPYVNLLGWPKRMPKCGEDTLLLLRDGHKIEVNKELSSNSPHTDVANKEVQEDNEDDPLDIPAVRDVISGTDISGTDILTEVFRMRKLHTLSLNRMESAAQRIGGPFENIPPTMLRSILHWALHNVKSRAHRGIGLMPVIDMFNDDPFSEIPTLYGKGPASPEDLDTRLLGFECGKDYVSNEEVRYSYTGGVGSARSSVIQFGYLPDDSDEGNREYGRATRALIRLAERELNQRRLEEEDTSPAAIYAARRKEQEKLWSQWDL
jgi:hypothetical protein